MLHDLNGIILVDKPAGITSAEVVRRIKKRFRAKKAGHTGTLDPFAKGLMICCINKATRLAEIFQKSDKTYDAVLRLGVETDTFDATGQVTAVSSDVFFSSQQADEKRIHSVFRSFKGASDQLPPVFSALKHKGVPLYRLARKGTPVQKPPRRIVIYDINIIDIDMPDIRFEVTCSAGTYIRTLSADIGKSLGCGGHLKELRRMESGGFNVADASALDGLENITSDRILKEKVIDMASALGDIPGYVADETQAERIFNGGKVTSKELANMRSLDRGSRRQKDLIKILDKNNRLIAVLKQQKDVGKYKYCCVFNN